MAIFEAELNTSMGKSKYFVLRFHYATKIVATESMHKKPTTKYSMNISSLQVDVTADIEVCDVEYSANEQKATATTAEVVFNKDCTTDTVTVCQPENADGTQECQEVEQETCFNEPAIEEVSTTSVSL